MDIWQQTMQKPKKHWKTQKMKNSGKWTSDVVFFMPIRYFDPQEFGNENTTSQQKNEKSTNQKSRKQRENLGRGNAFRAVPLH